MRATTLLKKSVGIKGTRVLRVSFDDEGVVCDVAPTTRIARCSGCGCKVRKVHDRRTRSWRHLDLAGMKLHLRYALRRVDCARCGVTSELVPWAAHDSWFTDAFEQTTAFLAQVANKTAVTKMMRVAWATVGAIIRRVVARSVFGDVLDDLVEIGVDELSYRKHHEYITIVTNHRTGRVVWAQPGKSSGTLRAFFEELGKERCEKLRVVSIDMSRAYITALKEAVPHVTIVFDRFHVQRLVHMRSMHFATPRSAAWSNRPSDTRSNTRASSCRRILGTLPTSSDVDWLTSNASIRGSIAAICSKRHSLRSSIAISPALLE